MRTNDRVRKKIAATLDEGETILATVMLANELGVPTATPDGAVRSSGSTALGTAYAMNRGIDLDDPAHRSDLMSSFCTLTVRRILFHRRSHWTVRPTPTGEIAAEYPADAVSLRWFDAGGLGLSNRVFHFDFPDGKRLVSATMVKAKLRRRPFNDEPFLFVDAFGERALEVENA